MKHEIKRGYKFSAKVNWHTQKDLRQPTPKQGEIIEVEAMWLMDEEDNNPGEWAFIHTSRKYPYWIAESELEIIKKI